MEQTVTAIWHGNEYRAQLDHFGVAVIASGTEPEHVEDVDIDRYHDDGGAVSV